MTSEGAALRARLWPLARQEEVAATLARAAGLARPAAPAWFQLRRQDTHPALSSRARDLLPAFFRVEAADDGAPEGWLAVLAHGGATARVVGPDGVASAVAAPALAALLRAAAEARASTGIDGAVTRAALPPD